VDSIARLPDCDIHAGGIVGAAFLGREITTFRRACQWVKDLPYGHNTRVEDAMVLFEDERGTCFTKHGVIARLAGELELSVYKNLGFYRLNDEIVTGVAELLKPHGLSFVPQIHCFLEYRGFRVDLTEGNCNGKNKTIDDYDFVVPVAAESTRAELQQLYADHCQQYRLLDPRLAGISMSAIGDLMMACNQLMAARCAVMAAAARQGAAESATPIRTEPATRSIS
jgi:hypothetical protein